MKVTVGGWAFVEKSALTALQLARIKSELTIVPEKIGNHPGDPPPPLHLWTEHGNLFGMAREYYMARRAPHHEVEIHVTEGNKAGWADLKFAASLREEQAKARDVLVREFKENARLGGLVRAPTGWG